ncbi:MAG: patatin-like phospholipase family protein [Gammaproteobacteria bacterium]|nr:patatin-like phospholipase family protein [Gammaproteobacteria bacterium]
MSVKANETSAPAKRRKAARSNANSSGGNGARSINLALQGGGAHGAFTCGVLDRLLEDERIAIEAISGTSAGAMNAVALADGFEKGGREGAREALHRFWRAASEGACFSLIQRTPWDQWAGNWSLNTSPGYLALDMLTRLASPYELNPFNLNPLKDFLARQIDFDTVRCCGQIKLFVSATSVRTGRARIFRNAELSPDAVMASACLPNMFQAVEIDGEAFWDGGYMGNPALHPFIYRCATRDIVIVQINPIDSPHTPKRARDILDRINEINFNSSLLAELRAIEFVTRLLDDGQLDPKRYKRMLIHRIDGEAELTPLDASSKVNAEWVFLEALHGMGYRAASKWLARHFDELGETSSVNLRSMFAGA